VRKWIGCGINGRDITQVLQLHMSWSTDRSYEKSG